MNSYTIATVGLIAAACLIAATIAVPTFTNSAYAQVTAIGGGVSQGAGQTGSANGNGVAGVNVGVQAQIGHVCVNALSNAGC